LVVLIVFVAVPAGLAHPAKTRTTTIIKTITRFITLESFIYFPPL
jgi:hypothetical protein